MEVDNVFQSSSRVPPEIAHNIIDQLRDNWRALQACSAVCRAWLPRARYHLFKHIELYKLSRVKSLKSLIETINSSAAAATLPNPLHYTRTLSVLCHRESHMRSAFARDGYTLTKPHSEWNFKSTFLAALGHMKNVEDVTLSRVDFPHLSADVRHSLSTFSSVITALTIEFSIVGGPLFCEQLLKVFPKLEIISLRDVVRIDLSSLLLWESDCFLSNSPEFHLWRYS